jgi:energy-coupling factor transporter ATP-binding protein EcfA2
MLRQFQLRNFKSFKEATLELGPLSVLIGANASGKSNLLEALQLYAWLAGGRRVDHVFFALRDREIELRGGPGSFTRFGSLDPIRMCAVLEDEHGVSSSRHEVELLLGGDSARVVRETLHDLFPHETILYEAVKTAEAGNSELKLTADAGRRGRRPSTRISDQQLALTQRWHGLDLEPEMAHHHDEKQEWVSTEVRNITFIDPVPKRMRGYAFNVETTLKSDCANVSAVLHRLCNEPGMKDSVLEFIGAIPEKDVIDIGFVTTPRTEVMVQLVETFGNREAAMDASVLSDGTLRVLAVAAAVLSVPEHSTLVIEEIDNGVHPSRVGILLRSILAVATRRHLHVLITTHSPSLLDSLPESAVPAVQVCYRDPDGGDSRVVRLDSLSQYPELIAQGRLGGLVSRGILERYLKTPPESRESRLSTADRWLLDLGREADS